MKSNRPSAWSASILAGLVLAVPSPHTLHASVDAPIGTWRGEDGEFLTIGKDGTFDLKRPDTLVRASYTTPDSTHLKLDIVTRKGTNSTIYLFSVSAETLTLTSPANQKSVKFQRISSDQLPREPSKSTRINIYDESADGSKQIDAALTVAKRDSKHVLLQFGANWCGWCRKLHKLFETDERIREELEDAYVVVLVNVDGDHNKDIDLKYGHPTQYGLPAIVVLDDDGKSLTVQDTGKLEQGEHHDPEKVIAFLKKWATKK